MELKELRAENGIMAKDMVNVVRRLYPKYDKTLHSKCERGIEYGVTLRSDAMTAICTAFNLEQPATAKKRKPEKRKLPCRISCRLTEDEYEQLQQFIQEDGYDTMQSWLAQKVRQYIKRKAPRKGGAK